MKVTSLFLFSEQSSAKYQSIFILMDDLVNSGFAA